MAKKIDEILSESVGLTEDARNQIVGLWEARLSEAREEVAATLREEFARKFEHDKGVLVESMDRFLTDKVRVELEEFAEDKRQLVTERIAYKGKIVEHTGMLNKFITEAVAKEMKEFYAEKKAMKENFAKLENFLLRQLAEEIREFRIDKKSLVEQKVKMVTEGKQKLHETKTQFIKRAARIIESNIEKTLRSEISQFKDDIRVARENEFGRKIFESVAAEFMTSYLNEGTELKKIQKVVESKNKKIASLTETVKKSTTLVEGLDSKLKATQDLVERQKVMNELLAPLSKDKKSVMKELLESVQTKNLQGSYNKYLPSVLNEAIERKPASSKTQLNEATLSANTGNRVMVTQDEESGDSSELNHILSLAGIRK
jgi:S-adenosylmethionine:diacylglycerol 3-amino-3-carboxypropyl transferase